MSNSCDSLGMYFVWENESNSWVYQTFNDFLSSNIFCEHVRLLWIDEKSQLWDLRCTIDSYLKIFTSLNNLLLIKGKCRKI